MKYSCVVVEWVITGIWKARKYCYLNINEHVCKIFSYFTLSKNNKNYSTRKSERVMNIRRIVTRVLIFLFTLLLTLKGICTLKWTLNVSREIFVVGWRKLLHEAIYFQYSATLWCCFVWKSLALCHSCEKNFFIDAQQKAKSHNKKIIIFQIEKRIKRRKKKIATTSEIESRNKEGWDQKEEEFVVMIYTARLNKFKKNMVFFI